MVKSITIAALITVVSQSTINYFPQKLLSKFHNPWNLGTQDIPSKTNYKCKRKTTQVNNNIPTVKSTSEETFSKNAKSMGN